QPKPTRTTQNPAAITAPPRIAGPKSALPPSDIKHRPITGTTRTENAPPVTMAVPYNRSQTPGSAATMPAWKSANDKRPPTTIGGAKLRRNLRPGPEKSAELARCALVAAAGAAMATATKASINQTASQARGVVCREAANAATSAVTPIATPPQPGTAVNSAALSMVSRM